MPKGITYPRQLAILTKALEDYCSVAHIEPGTPAHHDASYQVMRLYENGLATEEEIAKALRAIKRPN